MPCIIRRWIYTRPASRFMSKGKVMYKPVLWEMKHIIINLIYENNRWVGMILWWETEEFIYIEHFCILPEMRGKKYGQKALELLGGERKTVILEIDPPIDDVSVRRKRFYERSGYQANRFAHVHPPYKKGFKGHDLVVMSSPDQLSEAEYRAFNSYLSSVVMKRCLITKSSY